MGSGNIHIFNTAHAYSEKITYILPIQQKNVKVFKSKNGVRTISIPQAVEKNKEIKKLSKSNAKHLQADFFSSSQTINLLTRVAQTNKKRKNMF